MDTNRDLIELKREIDTCTDRDKDIGRWRDKHKDTYRKPDIGSDGDKDTDTCKDTVIERTRYR